MWCDRQPGSQPSISPNGNDLFAGLGRGHCGVCGKDDIDRICMSAKLQARGRLEGSCEGNKWSLMKPPNASLALCFDKVTY